MAVQMRKFGDGRWFSSLVSAAVFVFLGLIASATTTTEAFQPPHHQWSTRSNVAKWKNSQGQIQVGKDINFNNNQLKGRTNLLFLRDPRVVDDARSTSRLDESKDATNSRQVSYLESLNGSTNKSSDLSSSSDAAATDLATTLETATAAEKSVYRSAIFRTLGWVGAASLFGMWLLVFVSPTTSEEFFAGYLVEQSLSVDNLFVFLLLFEYFKVPLEYQDRVLNWGIFGAIVMRAIMIGLGAAALQNFHEILLVFAGILVYSAGKVLWNVEDDDEEDPSENAIVKFSQNLINSTPKFDGDRFFTMVEGVKTATPLFICMIAVEISDVVFAVDSIPAVFGVTEVRDSKPSFLSLTFRVHAFFSPANTFCFLSNYFRWDSFVLRLQNPLVVFTSNMFAIMGLRSLYTILSKAASDLKYLEPAVAVVLGFIGCKMILEYFGICIQTEVALAVVASLLGTGVGLSIYEKKQLAAEEEL